MATPLNMLEWIDAAEKALWNVAAFAPLYSRDKVMRFQKTTNVVAGIAINGPTKPPVPRLDEDGIWGPQTATAMRILLGITDPRVPSGQPMTLQTQYRSGTFAATTERIFAVRKQTLPALVSPNAAPPTPDATTEASMQAQAAVDAATDPLTAPPAPESPAMQPPPDVAPPGPQPPAPETPSGRIVRGGEFRVPGMLRREQGADVPWFSIALGVLAFAGVIGWAAYRKRQRSRA